MRGQVSKEVGTILLLIFVAVLIILVFIAPIPGARAPLEEQKNFLDLCIYWATYDFQGDYVVDNRGNVISMYEPCKKALGLNPLETTVDFEQCAKLCPNWRGK